MARAIQFNHSNFNFSASITKVDRKKVYGFSKVEVRDNNQKLCSLVSLNEDGTEILPSGSTGIAKFDSENNYIESSGIKAIDLEGNPAQLVPSVFDEAVSLKAVENLTEFLDINVKSIYQLFFEEDVEKQKLIQTLQETIFQFIFNYRSDYEGDDAFLITDGNEVFAVVGIKCEFEYLGLQEIVVDPDEEEEDDFDFGML